MKALHPIANPMLQLSVVQVAYLLLVAVMLVLRTYADVWMIQNGTSVEGYGLLCECVWGEVGKLQTFLPKVHSTLLCSLLYINRNSGRIL